MDLFTSTRNREQSQHFNRNEKRAVEKGYYCIGSDIYSPPGRKLNPWTNSSGYLVFSFPTGSRTDNSRKMLQVLVHRMIAYQKYGDVLYNFECVRHKDGNKLNNSPENVEPGTHKKNSSDIPKKTRVRTAVNASCHIRKFSDKVVAEIREQHYSYRETMKKYGISSKGTLWSILNRDYVTEKVG